MSEPKIILYKSKTYSDGSNPIMIQIIVKGKAVRKVISRCNAKYWLSSKSRVSPRFIEAPRINNEIEIALREFGLNDRIDFYPFFFSIIENYKLNNQFGRYKAFKVLYDQLLEYDHNICFQGLTERKMYDFAAYLRDSKKNALNTVREKMQVFNRVLRSAKKSKYIVDNPLDDITFKRERSIKDKLSVDEINKFSSYPLSGKQAEARDLFMSSIYLRGIRIGDLVVLKTSNIHSGRIVYKESKTGKVQNIAIIQELQIILDRWSGKNPDGYLFSFTRFHADYFTYKENIKKSTIKINGLLKRAAKIVGIDKNITPHTARHSFSRLANTTIKDLSITKDLIGHSSLSVHEGYISDISDDLVMDGYAQQVLDKLK
ncbi:site-specific integrase [Pedobacter punctiformis]|uniref:Site-specific integrase n=1 Tax=Pedobacter punctiformis TaxID=3004097 RepID=A0ABT4LDS3_9SPHI|nr:site-specific integrase [Pedobacter sp. HCMS5-2]MCZ4244994.1 site-specific integrase [Pedobacter sp. HCMS5-2]